MSTYIRIYFCLTLKLKKMEKKKRVRELIINIITSVISAVAAFFGISQF